MIGYVKVNTPTVNKMVHDHPVFLKLHTTLIQQVDAQFKLENSNLRAAP